MSGWSTHDIAARLATLIRREDAGDREMAAQRLRVPVQELERFLADESGPPRPEFLAAVVRGYDADACWLITGERDIRSAQLSRPERGEVAEILLAVANVLLDPRWARRTPPGMAALRIDGPSAEPAVPPVAPPRRRDEA